MRRDAPAARPRSAGPLGGDGGLPRLPAPHARSGADDDLERMERGRGGVVSEQALVQAILIAIGSLPGVMVWRNNTGGFKDVRGRWIRFGLVGSPDIIGCARGVPLGIECKTAVGKQRPEQAAFQRAWEVAGGLYILARTVADVTQRVGR